MRVTIPVYQRRVESRVEWRLLLPPPFDLERRGRVTTRVQQQLVDQLKTLIAKASTAELRALEVAKDTRLERISLALTLRGSVGRRRISGKYPLVIETRRSGASRTISLAYVPGFEEGWFPIDETLDLTTQAEKALRQIWAETEQDDIEIRRTDGRDQVLLIAFDVEPPSLLDTLEASSAMQGDEGETIEQILQKIGHDVTADIVDLEPVDRPRNERSTVRRIAGGQTPRSIVLLGPHGTGKRTLLRRLVHDLAHDDGFLTHRNLDRIRHVWRISGQRIIAGMKHLGDWEARAAQLIAHFRGRRDILWVEDVHAFGRIGRSRDSDRCLADVFRGPMLSGELILAGTCTETEWQRLVDDAPAFARAFERVLVPQPDRDTTLLIALHAMRLIEDRYDTSIPPSAINIAYQLMQVLAPDRAFPGKLIELLRFAVSNGYTDQGWLGTEMVIQAASDRTGVPSNLLDPDQPFDLTELREALETTIRGQSAAIEAALNLVSRVRCGLTDPRRPQGVFLFTGPTGTGKTEMARLLANVLCGEADNMLRIDLGEYSTPDAVARLVGDRFSPDGVLTKKIRNHPFSLVLLDEIEKAHPSVLNLLLQVFEDGRLTDAAGRTADFSRAVVVMTSNLGASTQAPVGFTADADAVMRDIDRAVKAAFPPEFFNRLDQVVPFRPLSREAAVHITRAGLKRLCARPGLIDRKVLVETTPAVVERVVEQAFDPRDGARPLKRYLERHIGVALTEHLVNHAPKITERIRILVRDDTFVLQTEALVEAEPIDTEYALAPLEGASPAMIRDALLTQLKELESFGESAEMQALSAQISAHAEAVASGPTAQINTLVELDAQRAAVDVLEEQTRTAVEDQDDPEQLIRSVRKRDGRYFNRLTRSAPHRAGALDGRELIARAATLHRLLTTPPSESDTLLILSQIGLGDHHFLKALSETYTQMATTLRWAALNTEDEITEGKGIPSFPYNQKHQRLVLEISGLGIQDALNWEVGCHVWSSPGVGTSMINVEVLDADGRAPKAHLIERLAANTAYLIALDKPDGKVPPDPDPMRPVVRMIRTEYCLGNRRNSFQIEDFLTGQVSKVGTQQLADALTPIWRWRASRRS